MKVHDTKEKAEQAIRQFASVAKTMFELTGADFVADADDDSGMRYAVEACYKDENGKRQLLTISFQDLDL